MRYNFIIIINFFFIGFKIIFHKKKKKQTNKFVNQIFKNILVITFLVNVWSFIYYRIFYTLQKCELNRVY